MRSRINLFLCIGFILCMLTACTSVDREKELQAFREEVGKENLKMSEMEEANLDDDLNPVEQKAVHKVFEKNRKETERTEKAIF